LKKEGYRPVVEIMIPQVSDVREIVYVKERAILPALRDVEREFDVKLDVKIGTMIETVRGCLTIDEIAKHVDFISFSTNDLTQSVFSFSRDDTENNFIPQYLELKILDANPFETIDVKGVGRLVEHVAATAKEVNPAIEVGVSGEHGGDPQLYTLLPQDKGGLRKRLPLQSPTGKAGRGSSRHIGQTRQN
jgi:pyruvate,orthophosphate dikinase